MTKKIRTSKWAAGFKCLEFIETHPGGTRRRAFPCGYRFNFEAPELKRSPFRITTLYALINGGYVTKSGVVALTPLGKTMLEDLRDQRSRAAVRWKMTDSE